MIKITSAIGRAVLMAREGCKLRAYKDTEGVWTIGVGHTGRASSPAVTPGMTITQGEADLYLARDLVPFEAAVNAAVRVSLTDNEFDACVSLAFNIGASGFGGSTLARRLNAGDKAGAADAFSLWEKNHELVSRREAERVQFLTPYTKSMPVAHIGESPIKSPSVPTVVTPAPPVPKPAPVVPSPGRVEVAPSVITSAPKTEPHKPGLLERMWIALTFKKVA